MRILYLADVRFPLERANGIQTIETCHALAARGHVVRLLVRPDTAVPPRDPLAFYGLEPDPRLRIDRVHVAGSLNMRRLGYLSAAIAKTMGSRSTAEVAMTRDLGVASVLLSIPARIRPPLVYESHGYAPVFAETMPEMVSGAGKASASKLARLAGRERRVWVLADGYVTITQGIADELVERFGRRRALAVVPDGVRLTPGRGFVPPAAGSRIVMYAGRLYPWKGVDTLLEALALLQDVRGVIVGGHPAERRSLPSSGACAFAWHQWPGYVYGSRASSGGLAVSEGSGCAGHAAYLYAGLRALRITAETVRIYGCRQAHRRFRFARDQGSAERWRQCAAGEIGRRCTARRRYQADAGHAGDGGPHGATRVR